MSGASEALLKELHSELAAQLLDIVRNGVPLDKPTGTKTGPTDYAPSLDRIRPALGYVPGNVRVISYKANRLRNNGTFIEIMQVAIDAARLHNVYGDF